MDGNRLKLREGIQVYVSVDPIDARKSIDSLSVLVMEVFKENPQSGHLFLFFNKSRDKVKVLWWDNNGFVLHYKRLAKHRFILPKFSESTTLNITETQPQGLLAGLDFMLMSHFPEINYHQRDLWVIKCANLLTYPLQPDNTLVTVRIPLAVLANCSKINPLRGVSAASA